MKNTIIGKIKLLSRIKRLDPFQGIGHLPLKDVDAAIDFLQAVSVAKDANPRRFEP